MSVIYLRKAQQTDINSIMQIINQAKQRMKNAGSPQWQDGHPTQEMINQDIQRQNGWVLMIGDQIAGYSVLQFTPEPTYKVIKDGQWTNNNQPYATIHRVAISDHYHGQHLSKFLFSNLITIGIAHGITNFRLDTHRVNLPMQRLAKSCGFKHCGTVIVKDKIDTIRMAFELNLGSHQQPIHHITNDFMSPLIK